MINRATFAEWVKESLHSLGGKASIIEICKSVWKLHGEKIQADDTAFYIWQYEIRWGGQILRDSGVIKNKDDSPRGVWELSESVVV